MAEISDLFGQWRKTKDIDNPITLDPIGPGVAPGVITNDNIVSNAVNDVVNKFGQWWQGAKQGGAEVIRAAQQMPASLSSAEMPGGAGLTPEDQTAIEYNQQAVSNFTNETIKPAAYTVGLVNPLVAAPFLVNDAANIATEEVNKGNTYAPNLAGAVAARLIGSDTVKQAVNNPQEFGQRFYNEPVTTLTELLPAALIGRGVYQGVKGRLSAPERTAEKVSEAGQEMKSAEIKPVEGASVGDAAQKYGEWRQKGQPGTPQPLEQWQVPKDDFIDSHGAGVRENPSMLAGIEQQHRATVEKAISEGKPIPDDVLADYPELTTKPEPAEFYSSNNEAGFSMKPSLQAAFNFKDPIRGLVNVYKNVGDLGKSIVASVSPASVSNRSRLTAGILRNMAAEKAQSLDSAVKSLEEARQHFVRNPSDFLPFVDGIEQGTKQSSPQLEKFATVTRKLLDTTRDEIRALGTGKLEQFIENYFPHIWKDPNRAVEYINQVRGPFEGSKGFLKKRSIDSISDGIKSGLEPISRNPVDITLYKLAEMQKYLAANKAIAEMKNTGLIQYVPIGKKKPAGFAKLNDSFASVYSAGEKGELILRGNYYAPPDVARIFNNHLSPGFRGNAAFRGYMDVANNMNQFQLGLSAFHLGFTSLDAIVSKVALAGLKLSRGDIKDAASDIVHSPLAPIETALKGDKLLREWNNPGSQGGEFGRLLAALKAGGGRTRMDSFYYTRLQENMVDALKSGNVLGAVFRSPAAAVQFIPKLIMEEVVPRQKLGVFMDLARAELAKNPNMSAVQMREVMGKVWDSVENRLGQLTYDNLFWNTKLKDFLMATVRSVGWNLGTWRELGGAAIDTAKLPGKIMRGEGDKFTYRMSYAAALPITAGIMGAITQYLYTGQAPQDMKDFFFPRTGELDQNGRPQRIALPSYMKDLYHYSTKPGETLANKIHPAVSFALEVMNNKDFYGNKVRNPEDNILAQAGQTVKHFGATMIPLSYRNYQQQGEIQASPVTMAMQFVGVVPAPSSVNKTKAELMAGEMLAARSPGVGRDQKQAARHDVIVKIRRDLATGKGTPQSLLDAVKAGQITPLQARTLIKERNLSPLQRQFDNLTADDAFRVYNVATAEEKKTLLPMLQAKVASHVKLNPKEAPQMVKRLREAK